MLLNPKNIFLTYFLLSFNAYSGVIVTEDSFSKLYGNTTHTARIQDDQYSPYTEGWNAFLSTTINDGATFARGYNFLGNAQNVEEINGHVDEVDEFLGDVLYSEASVTGVGDEGRSSDSVSTNSHFWRSLSIESTGPLSDPNYGMLVPVVFDYLISTFTSSSSDGSFNGGYAEATATIDLPRIFSDTLITKSSRWNSCDNPSNCISTRVGKHVSWIGVGHMFDIGFTTKTRVYAHTEGDYGYARAIVDPLIYIDPTFANANSFKIKNIDNNVPYQMIDSTTVNVPEPSTLAIFALGMIGLASRRFKKQS